MTEGKNTFSDNEYNIMTEITENENITQRELSRTLGVSVSTVNVLMNKMIKEGLVKMTQVSQKQVFYMLTPVGIMEKAKKTVRYLKIHYRAIYETKEKIKAVFEELKNEHDVIYVLKNDDEMGEMTGIAINEFHVNYPKVKIVVIDKLKGLDYKGFNTPSLVHMMENELTKEFIEDDGLTLINLLEKL